VSADPEPAPPTAEPPTPETPGLRHQEVDARGDASQLPPP
jgi:hypothetical protein